MKSLSQFSRLFFVVLSFAVLLLAGCGGSDSTTGQVTGQDEALPMVSAVSTLDYSQPANWRRKSPDNGYGPQMSAATQPVDVFFLYPSTFFPGPSQSPPSVQYPVAPESWNQTIAQAQADPQIEAQVYSKAGVFAKAGTNIYAPFYRQAAGAYVLPALLWKNNAQISPNNANYALALAYADIKRAFLHYLYVLNPETATTKGRRPFILAGHSQGSNLLLLLLKDLSNDPDVAPILHDKLITAYVIGWSVTSDDYSILLSSKPLSSKDMPICTSAVQTGCIVTYNTQQDPGDFSMATRFPGSPGSPPTGIVQKNAYSVNPLTWVANGPSNSAMGITTVTESSFASNTLNQGALFFKLNSVRPVSGTYYDLRPQLGPFIPLDKCLDSAPNCPGPSSFVPASPQVKQPDWDIQTIAGWSVNYYKLDAYTGARNDRGALVIYPEALPAPGNYQNLNPPYNTSDKFNDPNNVNNYDNQPAGWYHNYDYTFFWYNLEQNAIDRINAYHTAH